MRATLFLALGLLATGAYTQSVKVVKYHEVESLMNSRSDDLKVFNFWATWCGPCIKELPHFENANTQDNVQVYLVSLDFIQDKAKVDRFVAKKELKATVLLLDEKDYDSYMAKVSKSWSGAIPATLFVDNRGQRFFHEEEFTEAELQNKISKYLN